MKEDELRQLAKCCTCRRAIGQLPMPMFHRVNIERFILDVKAVQRQHGLEQQFNGCVALAQVFSPNEDMAVSLGACTLMICDECMLAKLPQAFDAMEQQEESSDADDDHAVAARTLTEAVVQAVDETSLEHGVMTGMIVTVQAEGEPVRVRITSEQYDFEVLP